VIPQEIAHVARGDYATQIADEIVRHSHWFNHRSGRPPAAEASKASRPRTTGVAHARPRHATYAEDLWEIAAALPRLYAPKSPDPD